MNTREALINDASALFAELGFDGTSIAAIALRRGLTKQALLHHFGSKEALYGEVLKKVSEQLERRVLGAVPAAGESPLTTLMRAFERLFDDSPWIARLVIRELLDNHQRAPGKHRWYLRGFVDALADTLLREPGWAGAERAQAVAAIYHLVGALSYRHISGPTLAQILGKPLFKATEQAWNPEFHRLVAAVRQGPA